MNGNITVFKTKKLFMGFKCCTRANVNVTEKFVGIWSWYFMKVFFTTQFVEIFFFMGKRNRTEK